MMLNRLIPFLFSALVLLSACSEQISEPIHQPASNQTQPKKIEAKNEAAPEAPPPKYKYEVTGRRDPFEPLLALTSQSLPVQGDEPPTPLQTYDLGQLRLVAVIIGKGPSSAMVLAPDGKGYILKNGVKVGKNNGKVTGIRADAVVIEEQFIDFTGEIKKRSQEIQLPKREGA